MTTTPDAMLPTFQDNEPLESQVNKLANFILDTCPGQIEGGAIETAVKIIAAWNRRAGQAHIAALLEALEAVTDDLEAEIEARRCTVLPRTTERDLATVRAARAAIAATKGA